MRKILLYLFVLLVASSAVAQSREDLEKRRKEIQQEIADLQRSQSMIQKDKKANLAQLALIQNKIRKRNAVINNINDQVKLIDNTIFTNNREIYRLKKQLDTLKQHYAKTVVYAYQNRSNYDMINFLFSSVSFNDAIRRVQYLKSYRGYREEQVDNINKTQSLLEQKINTLSENKKEKSKVLMEQTKEMKTLEEEKKEQNNYVTKLKAREKELTKELAAKKRVANNLQNAIAAIVKREIEAARKRAEEEARKEAAAKAAAAKAAGNESTAATAPAAKPTTNATVPSRKYNVLESTPEVTRVSVNFEQNKHNLPWPVEKGTISSPFGRKKIEGTTLYEDNSGVTIATVEGSSVKAVFEGVVSAVYDIQGSQTVTIKHGKYFTTYYNLSTVNVSKGDQVKMGQVIGKAGVNDDGDGEILFLVNLESRLMDPEQWLKPR
ncbi:MAG TPA: peptidoglycan DD-metalloendopeptidase family protein [Chitinophagaceae bacterium]|nr:peptidoglycan DD-metalloendopeptidase family protein [Chitinophagaceae bacterium]